MQVLVISASPNQQGLTARCAGAAVEGARAAGAQADHMRLKDFKIGSCNQCGNGWGGCRQNHECGGVQDDFQALHAQLAQADALALVTPVYWGEMSECAKAFTDRLRRCEATRGVESALANKLVIAVAAAGGGGGGMITCLLSMERWIDHVRAKRYDLIAINRWNSVYKIETIRQAAQQMVAVGLP